MNNNEPYSLDEWLALPRATLARLVASRRIAVMFWIDGTRRHYLLSRPDLAGSILDFDDYARHVCEAYVRVYDLMFELGIETIMTTILYPPNFRRGNSYVKKAILLSQRMLLEGPFRELYSRWNVRARLFGDYEFSPTAGGEREALLRIHEQLVQATPGGQRTLLLGYSAGSFGQEIIDRSVRLALRNGRPPDEAEVRADAYPDGPENIDIFITSGWLRVGAVLPPLLDTGRTDIYVLSVLALDINERQLRTILYDHIRLRWAGREDGATYDSAQLEELRGYYRTHQDCLIGSGRLVGPGMWHPDHPHPGRDPN